MTRLWLRDDCIHGEGKATIGQSAQFLLKYAEEISGCGVELTECEADPHLVGRQDGVENRRRAEIKRGKQIKDGGLCGV